MSLITETWKTYLDSYSNLEPSLLGGAQLSWLQKLRHKALDDFISLGLPTTKEENWKYTSVRSLAESQFTSVSPTAFPLEQISRYQQYFFEEDSFFHLVFLDGYFISELSNIKELPPGAVIDSLSHGLNSQEEKIREVLTSTDSSQSFTVLNTAFLAEGTYFYLPTKTVVSKPVHLLFITSNQKETVATHLRNLIILEPESELSIVEHYIGLDENVYFTNTVTHALLSRGAKLEHIKLQEESKKSFHISTIEVQQQEDSQFISRNIALGGQLARTDIYSVLAGQGAHTSLDGLYLLNGVRHVDNHTQISHEQSHTTSKEYYKGILNDKSCAVFNGRVVVHPNTQKVDAQQANHNLLLSKDSEIDTKPELEIYADDVKCTHGATVGQLDKNQIFYLRTRGIPEELAYQLLITAFSEEVVDKIPFISIRKHIKSQINAQFLLEK
ncbi:Fe-S cluster assembly protein SufD [Candidatus Nitrosacidococcus tergens]|uniref:Iron-regulated ABC transporter permease protein SufD n=1 Tax=Candidatus Nitrosacidococcus tergens TaxID=553981 RepID=A0A7G1QAK3_9GAMM|nr:Fe-S cluster assembly protein SufD [Candidatus Nitrosacidococcus tergens]CAB1276621.1 Iron-regulated ABC transporter permease protein SufD [Candidatus Nitrosacidococcus tergens]